MNEKQKKKLVIIGCGPKAMAIAAKAMVLNSLNINSPDIHIIEKRVVASNWCGKYGFTDGSLLLGTPPEKDIGFPYDTDIGDSTIRKLINQKMLQFSWQYYLQDIGEYCNWIDQGKPKPTHYKWSQYLTWIYNQLLSHVTLHHGEVFNIGLKQEKWVIDYKNSEGKKFLKSDGLVVTGPGKPNLNYNLVEHQHILSYESYWKNIHKLSNESSELKIAILGNGESAASIISSLISFKNQNFNIDIIAPSGAIYTRGESNLENRFYTNPLKNNWTNLSLEDRRKFILRTDIGVFSQDIMSYINCNNQISIVAGKVQSINLGANNKICLHMSYNEQKLLQNYDYVICSNGFDPYLFLNDLLNNDVKRIIAQILDVRQVARKTIEENIQFDLSVKHLSPKLFLPMLSSLSQGPGFSNLSCLGRVSDRILQKFI